MSWEFQPFDEVFFEADLRSFEPPQRRLRMIMYKEKGNTYEQASVAISNVPRNVRFLFELCNYGNVNRTVTIVSLSELKQPVTQVNPDEVCVPNTFVTDDELQPPVSSE